MLAAAAIYIAARLVQVRTDLHELRWFWVVVRSSAPAGPAIHLSHGEPDALWTNVIQRPIRFSADVAWWRLLGIRSVVVERYSCYLYYSCGRVRPCTVALDQCLSASTVLAVIHWCTAAQRRSTVGSFCANDPQSTGDTRACNLGLDVRICSYNNDPSCLTLNSAWIPTRTPIRMSAFLIYVCMQRKQTAMATTKIPEPEISGEVTHKVINNVVITRTGKEDSTKV